MPNIGAFIAWGFITALFIPTGWWPNASLGQLVEPMLRYLLPLLIAMTAGRHVAGDRGGVIAAVAVMGVILGSDIPMFIGAMAIGPFAGWVIRSFDRWAEGRIPAGFEMLVNNFSVGILGIVCALIGFYAVGPVVSALTVFLSAGVSLMIEHGLLPLVAVFIEPAKVLFLNNAINHGIFSPIGIEQRYRRLCWKSYRRKPIRLHPGLPRRPDASVCCIHNRQSKVQLLSYRGNKPVCRSE